jgi:hypothetical protein
MTPRDCTGAVLREPLGLIFLAPEATPTAAIEAAVES